MRLRQAFDEFDCDKGGKHGYDTVYERYFGPVQHEPVSVLEVGIFKGASLSAMLSYFSKAELFGIDVFTRVTPESVKVLDDPRVTWLEADSTTVSLSGWEFDFIIDDGAHTPDSNARTFWNLSPLLKPKGVYFIEDVWPLDTLTSAQKNHPWLRKHRELYDEETYRSFKQDLSDAGWTHTLVRTGPGLDSNIMVVHR